MEKTFRLPVNDSEEKATMKLYFVKVGLVVVVGGIIRMSTFA